MTLAAAPAPTFDKGLANTIAAETQMSFIDGGKGVLEYVGIDIDSLARNSTFEETVYLLWNRRLPNLTELAAFTQSLRDEYELPEGILDLVRTMPREATPLHALRTLVSALSLYDAEADAEGEQLDTRKLTLADVPVTVRAPGRRGLRAPGSPGARRPTGISQPRCGPACAGDGSLRTRATAGGTPGACPGGVAGQR